VGQVKIVLAQLASRNKNFIVRPWQPPWKP